MGVLCAISGKEAGRPRSFPESSVYRCSSNTTRQVLKRCLPVREASLEVHERILGAAQSATQMQDVNASLHRPLSRMVDQDFQRTELERLLLGARQVVVDDAVGFAEQACADDQPVDFDDAEMDAYSKLLPEPRQVVARKEVLGSRVLAPHGIEIQSDEPIQVFAGVIHEDSMPQPLTAIERCSIARADTVPLLSFVVAQVD